MVEIDYKLTTRVLTNLSKKNKLNFSIRQITIFLNLYEGTVTGSVKDFAKKLNLAKPVISRALDRLENLGLLKRIQSQEDRRIIIISRTRKGEDFFKHIQTETVQ